MANHTSAKKRIRQTKRRTGVNIRRLSRIRTFMRKVETAITQGERTVAEVAYRDAQPEMMRGVNKGLMHRNTVSRKLSRWSKKINALAA